MDPEVTRPLLQAAGLTISFGGIDVVAGLDLELRRGEIHAVIGENGAGKSSAAKALAGVYQPRLGEIKFDGQIVRLKNPLQALEMGIALIHQEPLTFPDLTVAENIFAGHLPTKAGRVDWARMNAEAAELLQSVGGKLDPTSLASGLSVAEQQRIELASALSHRAQVWIFDETTAALTPNEAAELFAVMRRLRNAGNAIMMVTHHLQEVFAVADRITVLRDGKKVGECQPATSSIPEVVQMMVGREISGERFTGRTADVFSNPILRLEKLSGPGFRDVSLSVRAGEITGIGGLVGAGRSELMRALFGITRPTGGEIFWQGQIVRIDSPRQAQRIGMAMVPEDRRGDGLLLPQSITLNATLADLPRLSPGGWLRFDRLRALTEKFGAQLNLAYRGPDQPVGQLSGGNQQKVVLAKWLMKGPKLLILDEPTRGVDVGAKHEVHTEIRKLADEGMAVIMVSSDLPELLRLSDRILVMREGRLTEEIPAAAATEEIVMAAATGTMTPVGGPV
jgi:rhamnose transport system ATP-binding protein